MGRSGSDGSPGLPGVSAWLHNKTELLIPPSIAGKIYVMNIIIRLRHCIHNSIQLSGKDGEIIIVQEGESVKLRCGATGKPPPETQWSSGAAVTGHSGGALKYGSWRVSSQPGPLFEMPRVSRQHAGPYLCTAFNGVPPQANRTIHLEVHCEFSHFFYVHI